MIKTLYKSIFFMQILESQINSAFFISQKQKVEWIIVKQKIRFVFLLSFQSFSYSNGSKSTKSNFQINLLQNFIYLQPFFENYHAIIIQDSYKSSLRRINEMNSLERNFDLKKISIILKWKHKYLLQILVINTYYKYLLQILINLHCIHCIHQFFSSNIKITNQQCIFDKLKTKNRMDKVEPQKFDWVKAQQEVQTSTENITQSIRDILRTDFGIIDNFFNCQKLKNRLLQLLRKIEVDLKTFGKYLKWKSNQFKNSIDKSYFTSIANIQFSTKMVLGISSGITLITGIILGFQYFEIIALGTLTQTGLRIVFGGALITVLVSGFKVGKQFWKGKQNSNKLKQAISLAEKAANDFENQKKQLQ